MSCNLSDSTVGPVWFTAMKTDGIVYTEPTPASPLIFDDNIASLGPGFDPVTSIFTAPVRGLYFFTATLRQHNMSPTSFYMMLNGVHYSIRHGEVDSETWHNTATVNTIVKLAAGDTMHVQVNAGGRLLCTLCNFDGCLLHRHI